MGREEKSSYQVALIKTSPPERHNDMQTVLFICSVAGQRFVRPHQPSSPRRQPASGQLCTVDKRRPRDNWRQQQQRNTAHKHRTIFFPGTERGIIYWLFFPLMRIWTVPTAGVPRELSKITDWRIEVDAD